MYNWLVLSSVTRQSRMASSGMLCPVALVKTDGSEKRSTSIIRVTRIGELGTTLVTANVVPRSPILVTRMKEEEEWRLLECYALWLL
jgi:hypothetical protein